jgi:hypothetical protein
MDPDRIRAPWHFPLVLSQTIEERGRFTQVGCAARQTQQSHGPLPCREAQAAGFPALCQAEVDGFIAI